MLRNFLSRRPLRGTVPLSMLSRHESSIGCQEQPEGYIILFLLLLGVKQPLSELLGGLLTLKAGRKQTSISDSASISFPLTKQPAHFLAKGCSTSPATSPAAALAIAECLFFIAPLTMLHTHWSKAKPAKAQCFEIKRRNLRRC